MIEYTFKKGEEIRLSFRVCNSDENESLVIPSAEWEMLSFTRDGCAPTVVNSGQCTVSDDYVIRTSVIQMSEVGDYVVRITAEITPEIRKYDTGIRVVY